MKYHWKYFYQKVKQEMQTTQGNDNYPYLSVLQENTRLLEEWLTRCNILHYAKAFHAYSLNKFNDKDLSLYSFTFDWCSIASECAHFLRKEPSSFEHWCTTIYALYDFLLSYNSLIDCPDDVNAQLYYCKSGEHIFYECKFPPILYDLDLQRVETPLPIGYCEVASPRKQSL